MSLRRTHWQGLSENLRRAVQARTGPVLNAQEVSGGLNSEIAALLETPRAKVFIKGLRRDHPRVWTQQMEAMINPYVVRASARLLWHINADGWDVLVFEYVAGRHADYTPGSDDIAKVVEVVRLLGKIQCPDLPVKRAEQRLAPYTDDISALRGDTLLHTDLNPLNVLINNTARIIDWRGRRAEPRGSNPLASS